MASVNKVILVGNLGADPEVRQFDNGGKIANVSIATSERWTDKQTGEPREHTEWHRVVFNDRLADVAAQYLRKGSQIYVEGSLRTRKWQDGQTGQDRYSTEIRANIMQMLGHKNNGFGGQDNYNQPMQNQYGGQGQAYPQNHFNQAPMPNHAPTPQTGYTPPHNPPTYPNQNYNQPAQPAMNHNHFGQGGAQNNVGQNRPNNPPPHNPNAAQPNHSPSQPSQLSNASQLNDDDDMPF